MSRSVLLLLPLLLLPFGGCANSHGSMMELVDAGVAHEAAARDLERRRDFPPAAERYDLSHGDYAKALEIARVRNNLVIGSFIVTKLSIVSSGHARCVEPVNDPEGSWPRSRELYARARDYADSITMLKLKANALCDEARCTQPDHDPQGSWEKAAALYAEAAAVCDGLKDDEGRGAALRQQALCLTKGDRGTITPEARALLSLARKLGDEEAAEILTSTGGSDAFCIACGADRRADARFCPECGRDQTKPASGEGEGRKPRRNPNAPGGPAPGGGGGGGD